MWRRPTLPPAIQLALLAAIVLALVGVTGYSALQSPGAPQFQQIVTLGPGLALVLESGPFCVPDAPLAACHTRARQELRIWYYAGSARHELLTHVWPSERPATRP